MSDILELTLDICPSVNHAYKNASRYARNGKVYMGRILSEEADNWKTYAGYETQSAMRKQGFVMIPEKVKFVLEVDITWKDLRHGDCSNIFKLLEDAMKGVAFFDDKYCLPRVIDFRVNKEKPCIKVKIYIAEKVA